MIETIITCLLNYLINNIAFKHVTTKTDIQLLSKTNKFGTKKIAITESHLHIYSKLVDQDEGFRHPPTFVLLNIS